MSPKFEKNGSSLTGLITISHVKISLCAFSESVIYIGT